MRNLILFVLAAIFCTMFCYSPGGITLYKIDRTLINLTSDTLSVEGTGIKPFKIIPANDTFSYFISHLNFYGSGGMIGADGLEYLGDTLRISKNAASPPAMYDTCKTLIIPFDTSKYGYWQEFPQHISEYVLYSDTIRILDSMLSTCGGTIIIHE